MRPLLLEEAARRRRLETRFVSMLERAGFDEVVLPIIDYADPYGGLLDARRGYRFVDREGELVTIRSDFTPMVARALAPSLSALPLKVFYRGDVIRCEASRLGANRELFQIGAEIVGDASSDADAEAMLLAASVARELGVRPLVVYNDVSIAASLDRDTLDSLKTKRRAGSPAGPFSKLIDGTATLDDIASFAPLAATRLREVQRIVGDRDFTLQPDDVDEPGYYTGIRFRIYDAATRALLAQGGRYDSLYGRFGTPAAAIGFTFTIDAFEEGA
ncbi:MAG TPA: ATP phosphoribosyltransferase regulatory subunit [Thermoanaerobaculia bacterium]|nr:ATP phosphoribosyltransferase regulatory subunit [Thermoanaerobaculia bacterium]